MSPRSATLVVVALLASACADGGPASSGAEAPTPASAAPTTRPVEPPTSSVPTPDATSAAVPAAACVPGPARPGIDLETGRILRLYNAYNDAALVEVIGDGPVRRGGVGGGQAPAPVALQPWPVLQALWAGDRMLVVGAEDQTGKLTVLGYDPAADAWSVARAPEERNTVGAPVWTGSELLLVGGDLNARDDTAWAYEPAGDRWRRLADPGIPAVEGMEGVWTGAEAIFYGGYGAGPPVAYDPATGGWRRLAAPPQEAPIGHELIWTGDRVLLFSGHIGPSHPDRVLSYDPMADAWEVSEPIPIAPRERLAGAWAGDRLLIWGGYATYGEVPRPASDGAAYVPATDSWHVLPASPLSDRCDHSGTWTGTTFVVFGGLGRCGSPGVVALGDAASYDPAAVTWELLAP